MGSGTWILARVARRPGDQEKRKRPGVLRKGSRENAGAAAAKRAAKEGRRKPRECVTIPRGFPWRKRIMKSQSWRTGVILTGMVVGMPVSVRAQAGAEAAAAAAQAAKWADQQKQSGTNPGSTTGTVTTRTVS